jgi:outer membrane protein OmpA-like peptidoglycan-associated protein
MARYDTYQSNAAEIPIMRKWLIRALILSLIIHAGLLVFFNWKKLENFGYSGEERLAPPTRVSARQVIIPEVQEDTKLTLPSSKPSPVVPIPLETDKPEVQIITAAPQMPEVTKPIVSEKPSAAAGGIDMLSKLEHDSVGQLEKQLSGMMGGMLDKSTRVKGQPVIKVPPGKNGDGGSGNMSGIPGRQSLDDALARTGPLPVGDKPIGVPGGALYEYNSYELRPEAVDQLRKLGELIKRNPKAAFSIEGHTDSTGTPEYNQVLSERRAESVKLWLVQFMGIAPERIQTRGFGATKLIVPADRSVDEQQPNRRVEIVIKTNR